MRGQSNIEVIAIHFDVPGHAIPLETFVRTSQETEAVIRGLSSMLFQEFQVELVVLPPEEGTFLARLGVAVAVSWGALLWSIESDVGKGLLKGLTGHEPAYWTEQLGRRARAHLEHVEEPDELPPTEDELASLVVSEMAKSFLSRDNDDLARAGIRPRQYREAFQAKNEFYRACIDTPEVMAIGFSPEPNFPIQRSDFVRLQAVLPAKEDDDVESPWTVETAVLRVSSPNWDRSDRGRRWKGRDQQGRDRLFLIEDEGFWQRVTAGRIQTHVIDDMNVQWAFQGSSDQRKNLKVLRVLAFNREPVSSPLSGEELENALGRLRELDDRQGPSLFD